MSVFLGCITTQLCGQTLRCCPALPLTPLLAEASKTVGVISVGKPVPAIAASASPCGFGVSSRSTTLSALTLRTARAGPLWLLSPSPRGPGERSGCPNRVVSSQAEGKSGKFLRVRVRVGFQLLWCRSCVENEGWVGARGPKMGSRPLLIGHLRSEWALESEPRWGTHAAHLGAWHRERPSQSLS